MTARPLSYTHHSEPLEPQTKSQWPSSGRSPVGSQLGQWLSRFHLEPVRGTPPCLHAGHGPSGQYGWEGGACATAYNRTGTIDGTAQPFGLHSTERPFSPRLSPKR